MIRQTLGPGTAYDLNIDAGASTNEVSVNNQLIYDKSSFHMFTLPLIPCNLVLNFSSIDGSYDI
jgi:hypothetical protein